MKRIITLLVWLCFVTVVSHCQPLQSIKAFDGTYRNANYAIETIVTGQQIKDYDLTLYHSLSVTDSTAIHDLNKLVASDMSKAINKEVGMRKGKINYGFFEFAPIEQRTNRFIFFFSSDSKAVLIYMEGDTSIEKIKSIIKR